jgi:hypothetical protein
MAQQEKNYSIKDDARKESALELYKNAALEFLPTLNL